ncbi:hypothetical protein OH491_16780 [Termitidicoccus mucosus]|uniref:Uncharacterized protein n=1 Tax=Termitidicoccus mucosus TaxID=1184151 RepID=A0A178IL47_9BACT|nr:hypothetical protein AW736_11815 [Opitutaceae bacterium TSB47]
MPSSTAFADAILSLSADSNDSACVALFMQLLRESPGLHRWLATAFLDPRTRTRLVRYLRDKERPPGHAVRGRQLLAWLAHANAALEIDTAALARTHALAPVSASPHGGLTRAQMIHLIRRYQADGAGNIALVPFLIAHAWRQAPDGAPPSAALLLMGGIFFQAVFAGDTPSSSLIRHLAKAVEFFHGQPLGSITRAHFGYVNWWKLSVLHYMLNHPKPCYRTRDFARHLAVQKITVDTKDLRRFCKKHGITRDIRPGRPRRTAPV